MNLSSVNAELLIGIMTSSSVNAVDEQMFVLLLWKREILFYSGTEAIQSSISLWNVFFTLSKAVQTFESVDEIPKCDHFNESYWAVLSRGAIFMLSKAVQTSESADEIPKWDY